ncbi:hypothetical protein [Bradyrhizobium sp. Ash2021]|uniref:hypothetical protein n=1 Tax=Bradyrhizobium sp. Ash2021 TaxID=2954771 RepID=UPI0028151D7C|nr:hypothetical protein [Bradyrhizobium sp. Ash2021]WMT75080.1 hypothetical protein NL528_01150 [Bradyrhizobium sp. Ash2021]
MRQEIKNDITIRRLIKSNGDGTVDVELSTGQIGTCKWDFAYGLPIGPIDIVYNKQRPGDDA